MTSVPLADHNVLLVPFCYKRLSRFAFTIKSRKLYALLFIKLCILIISDRVFIRLLSVCPSAKLSFWDSSKSTVDIFMKVGAYQKSIVTNTCHIVAYITGFFSIHHLFTFIYLWNWRPILSSYDSRLNVFR